MPKRIGVIVLLFVLLLTSCGREDAQTVKKSVETDRKISYREQEFCPLPYDGFYDGDMLHVTNLERNQEGLPAMYCLEMGWDAVTSVYAQITEYSLSAKGNWTQKVIGKKSLTKKLKKNSEAVFDMPFITRGDDGNLYALLQTGNEDKKTYSVLQMEEDADTLYEVKLQKDYADEDSMALWQDDIAQFHVMEDGEIYLIFTGGSVMSFDPDSGAPLFVSVSVPDSALCGQVGFLEHAFVYYSSSAGLFGMLDRETMTVSGTFGNEIAENRRGREWHFDTNTDNWNTYAFNTLGLYALDEKGKKMTTVCLSEDHAFSSLEEAVIYDVLVDAKETVYLLVRQKAESGDDRTEAWNYGVVKWEADTGGKDSE